MNFLLTTYIYPLAEPLQLSAYLNIHLDNPRTEDEISLVEGFLTRARDSGEDYALPTYSEENIVTVEDALFRLRDFIGDADDYFEQRFQAYSRDDGLRFIASIWVIARYDDKGATQELYEFHKEARARGELTFSILEEDDPIEKGRRSLESYGYLLSLLTNSEGDSYHGRGFIIANPKPTTVQNKSMWFSILIAGMVCPDGQDEPLRDDPLNWIFFPYARGEMEAKSRLLDDALESGLSDKLLYVGSLLRVAAEEARNDRIRLVVLTSILELLVTHSPDYNRFNVEESIGKQFRLKVGLLVYLNNRTQNINQIGKRLRVIYQQRSNIAHGNFDAIDRYVQSLSKKEGEEEYFDDLISDLYTYIRAVIEEYLRDRTLVEFLKAN